MILVTRPFAADSCSLSNACLQRERYTHTQRHLLHREYIVSEYKSYFSIIMHDISAEILGVFVGCGFKGMWQYVRDKFRNVTKDRTKQQRSGQ